MSNQNPPSSRRFDHPLDSYLRDESGQPDEQPSDKSPLKFPKNAPKTCAFCSEPLEGKEFTAFSSQLPASAMCCDCIDRFAIMNRFCCSTLSIWFWPVPDYSGLKRSIFKRMLAQTGSVRLKHAIADLMIRMAQRASACLMGQKDTCSRTGVGLRKIRVAFVGHPVDLCAQLLRLACDETGIMLMRTAAPGLANGNANAALLAKLNNEQPWGEIGLICCAGYAQPNAECSIVYVCEGSDGIPPEVEIIATE